MKKLLKFVIFVGGVAAAAWYLKNLLVPSAQSAVGPAPHFRTPHQPAPPPPPPQPATKTSTADDAESPGDDLTRIKGIGPVYSKRLAERGITTFDQLAAADAAVLAEELEVSSDEAASWIAQATSRP